MSRLILAANRTAVFGAHLQIVRDRENGAPLEEIEVQGDFGEIDNPDYPFLQQWIVTDNDLGESFRAHFGNTTGTNAEDGIISSSDYRSVELFVGDRNVDDIWHILDQVQDQVRAHIEANPLSFNYDINYNSNTFVNTLLSVVGIDINAPASPSFSNETILDSVRLDNPRTPTLPVLDSILPDDSVFPGSQRNFLANPGTSLASFPFKNIDVVDLNLSGLNRIDYITTGNGNDTLRGNGGDDILDGGRGNNRLFGGAGDDILRGGIGNNFYDGGSGVDTLDYSEFASTPINLTINSGLSGDVITRGTSFNIFSLTSTPTIASRDTFANIEGFTLSQRGDTLILNDIASDLFLDGEGGFDTLRLGENLSDAMINVGRVTFDGIEYDGTITRGEHTVYYRDFEDGRQGTRRFTILPSIGLPEKESEEGDEEGGEETISSNIFINIINIFGEILEQVIRPETVDFTDVFGEQGVVASSLAHKSYFDGLGQPIPSLCLKVPTGGGKTLLATKAVDIIQTRYFKRQTGLVLWIVPSSAIYQQTKAQLSKKSHPYRQMLERASGGRVKFFEKGATLTKQDTDNHLCVMLMMLQASNRKTKDVLKMFQDSGGYSDFFPDVDDYAALNAFWQATPNLDRYNLFDDGQPTVNTGIAIKQSLGNTLRLLRPMIVVDEGHKAYSDGARDTLTGFNPSFILELSATPNMKSHGSNVLCDVSGMALLREEMIKLPIVIDDHIGKTWKEALEAAWEQTQSLNTDGRENQKDTGDYIRPILLVRVDRTGKEQRDNNFLHSEDVREYMTDILGLQPDAIRVKSASKDEIAGEDLISELSQVRVIITKDALREGWDCPFAYVLAVLSTSKSETAMTQMIGRVLRQPYVRRAKVDSLNMCYVHCLDQNVKDVVDRIRKGLEDEGVTGVDQFVLGAKGASDSVPMQQVTLGRRKAFKGRKILLPRVLVREGKADARPPDYDRDILGGLDWESLSYSKADTVELAEDLSLSTRTVVQLVEEKAQYDLLAGTPMPRPDVKHEAVQHVQGTTNAMQNIFLIRKLIELVPNPWQAARILKEAMETLLARPNYSAERLAKSKLSLIDAIKDDLRGQIDAQSEALFRAKVKAGEITFRLLGSGMDFAMHDTITVTIPQGAGVLTAKGGHDLTKPLYEKVYHAQLNPLEQQAAIYLDGKDPLKWWHRVAVSAKNDYYLQGWKKSKVFPDFLCWMELDSDDGAARLLALETKGKHLDGSDTAWKERLFDILQETYESGQELGQLELTDKQAEKMTFKLLMQTQDEKAMLSELESVFN